MFFLSDLNTFGRKLGSIDKTPRKKRLGLIKKSILSGDTANSTGLGIGLGWGTGRLIDTFRKGQAPLGERYGILAGAGIGAAIGTKNAYNRLKNKFNSN